MKICERCGQSFACGATDTSQKCWCKSMGPMVSIPIKYKDCLCPTCLNLFKASPSAPKTVSELVEDEDYYYEGVLMVFTEKYHLKKGFCCGNNCRHCPY